jgi:phage recombination protein Bet
MTTEIVKSDEKPMEYVPFGSQDKIKLSVAIVQNLICVKTRSGKVCSPADAMKFMMLCQARKLNPFEGDAFLIGYDGKDGPTFSLITAHQAFLKRAEVNPEYDGMKSGIIVEEDDGLKDLEGDFYMGHQKVVGGWATVFFKNRKQPMHKRIRLERFQKSFGIWQDDAAGMICKCAEADALRSSFPTMLGGLYIKEEQPVSTTVEISAPLFTTPATPSAPSAPSAKEEKPATEVKTEPPGKPINRAVAAAEKSPAQTYPRVDGLRKAIADAFISEAQIITFLREMGVIDAATKTVEDFPKLKDDVFELLESQWSDIVTRIKEAK